MPSTTALMPVSSTSVASDRPGMTRNTNPARIDSTPTTSSSARVAPSACRPMTVSASPLNIQPSATRKASNARAFTRLRRQAMPAATSRTPTIPDSTCRPRLPRGRKAPMIRAIPPSSSQSPTRTASTRNVTSGQASTTTPNSTVTMPRMSPVHQGFCTTGAGQAGASADPGVLTVATLRPVRLERVAARRPSGGERVQHGDVQRDHQQRPDRVGGQPGDLDERVQHDDDDPGDARPGPSGQQAEAGDHEDRAGHQQGPAPAGDVHDDQPGRRDDEALVPDQREDALQDVERADHDEHRAGEEEPAGPGRVGSGSVVGHTVDARGRRHRAASSGRGDPAGTVAAAR